MRLKVMCLSLIIALASALSGSALAQDEGDNCTVNRDNAVDIDEAKLIIEYQSSDGDLGVHGSFDSPGVSELCVYDPAGALILVVNPQAQLGELGMSSMFFESREPLLEAFGFADLEANYPEGEYTVWATAYEGQTLTGAAIFSHDVPAPPVITAPELADDEDAAENLVLPLEGLIIEWAPVTVTVAGDPVEIIGYEVIVTQDEHDDPNGFSRPEYDVHLPPDRTSLSIPPEFLQPGELYEVEVLALEISGNQTITVGFFKTE